MEIENTNIEMQQPADPQDAFLDGWGDDDTPEIEQTADQQAETVEGQAQETAGAAADEGAEAGEGATAATGQSETPDAGAGDHAGQPAEATAPQTWTLKHMGETKTVSAADITPELLQKGLDYDRVRGKYDEAKPAMEMIGEFAKAANMSIPDYIKHLRAEAKKSAGMSEAEARRTVELEDREAAVSAREAAQQEGKNEQEARTARIRADIADFAKAFPDVYDKAKTDPKVIPQSVWDEVNRGEISLTAAYSRYAVAEANAQAQTARDHAAAAVQNQRNAARSTGSMMSAGNDNKNTDAFLEGFDA